MFSDSVASEGKKRNKVLGSQATNILAPLLMINDFINFLHFGVL